MPDRSSEAVTALQDLPWIRNLARALVRDASTADDLVQDALLSTLEHPLPEHVPVRQSLAVRLRNRARSLYRTSLHREQRESRVARSVAQVDDEVETRERLALAQRIVELMGELREPYRSVLRLRFLDDLPPREIARRTGRDVELIKLQVQRGLALLRAELDRGSGGDRRAWVAAFLPWIARPAHASASPLRRTWATIGACALLALAALSWLRIFDTPAVDARFASAETARSSGGGARLARPQSSTDGDSMDLRTPVPGATGSDVLVVRSGSREPVAAAVVRSWRLPRAPAGALTPVEWFRDGELEERLGEPFAIATTNGDGVARLPDTSSDWVVTASQADLWGWAILRVDGPAPPRIELRPDGDVLVLVQDRHGDPLGGVWSQLRSVGYAGNELEEDDCVYARGLTTAADGLARLRHAGYVKRARDSARKASALVYVAIPGLYELHPVTLDGSAWPSEPLEFRIAGPIGFCAIDFIGIRPQDQLEWTFQLDCSMGPGLWSYDYFGSGDNYSEHFEDWSGVALRPVALGKELRITARHRSGSTRQLLHAGPVDEGELVRVPFQLGASRTCVGRLVGVDGLPLRKTTFASTVATSEDSALHKNHVSFETDPEGGFQFAAADVEGGSDGNCIVSFRLEGQAGVPVAAARVVASLSESVLQLGDVRLEETPIVCAGRAVDQAGRPVPVALVSALFHTRDDTVRHNLSAQSDAEGWFELRSVERGFEWVSVKAEKDGYPTAFCDSARELHSLRLVFGAPGSLRGCVLVESSLRDALLFVDALREQPPDLGPAVATNWSSQVQRVCGENGEFAFEGLSPGEYELRVYLQEDVTGDSHLLEARGPIRVGVGGAAADVPPLSIDLRATHRIGRVTVQDQAGNPIAGAVVQVERELHRRDDLEIQYLKTDLDGGCQAILAAPASVIRAKAAGFAEAERVTPMDDFTVVVRPAVPARFQIAGGLPPLPPKCKLSLAIDDRRIHECGAEQEYFDALGAVDCCDPPSGVHEVRFELRYVRGGGYSDRTAEIPGAQQIRIDGTSKQLLDLQPPGSAELADAIRRLRDHVGQDWPK
jgi:RNA polymerase sigma factor (sigma-70 family)